MPLDMILTLTFPFFPQPQSPHPATPSPRQPSQPAEPPPRLRRTPSSSSTSSYPSGPAKIIHQLHTQYKAAALAAKKAGNKDQALQYMRTMKQIEPMLRAAESGQPVDLTTLPQPPGEAPSLHPRETLPEMKPSTQQTLVGHGKGGQILCLQHTHKECGGQCPF